MSPIEKIDYMIQSLKLAKDEIEYAENYSVLPEHDKYGCNSPRIPNGTTIRESLKMVGRLSYQVANEVSLSPYCSELFKEN